MTIVAIMKTTFPHDMPCKEYNFLFWSLIRKKENDKVSGTSLVDSAGFSSSHIGHWLRAHHIWEGGGGLLKTFFRARVPPDMLILSHIKPCDIMIMFIKLCFPAAVETNSIWPRPQFLFCIDRRITGWGSLCLTTVQC